MTYQEAVEKINSLLVFGSKPGLERIRELVDRIGAPDRRLKFVHVAGTNGKGSVCAYVAGMLQAAGYKTGLFISPYVINFRERFQINGSMIPEEALAEIVEEIYPVVQTMKAEGKIITEFEMVLAAALLWFDREACDIVVLETGLGGRFDATNIIDTPLVSVIMSISLDHTAVLGDTVEKIAFEKCGIIKEGGVTVLYGDQPEGVLEVVQQAVTQKHNRLLIADPSAAKPDSMALEGSAFTFCTPVWDQGQASSLKISMSGEHQLKNAAAALYTIVALRQQGIAVPEEAVEQGLLHTTFPARLELLQRDPVVLLDGAHNPGGAQALAAAVRKYLGGRHLTALTGMLADKDVKGALSALLPLFDEIVTTEPDNPRKMSAEALGEIASGFCPRVTAVSEPEDALKLALEKTQKDGALVIFGSLYLASELRRIYLEKHGGK